MEVRSGAGPMAKDDEARLGKENGQILPNVKVTSGSGHRGRDETQTRAVLHPCIVEKVVMPTIARPDAAVKRQTGRGQPWSTHRRPSLDPSGGMPGIWPYRGAGWPKTEVNGRLPPRHQPHHISYPTFDFCPGAPISSHLLLLPCTRLSSSITPPPSNPNTTASGTPFFLIFFFFFQLAFFISLQKC